MSARVVEFPVPFSVALFVLAGEFGNGQERIDKLKAEGFDPVVVQNCVNDLCEIIEKYKGGD